MNVLVLFIALLLILTKFLDVMSTLYRIHHASQETNPIAGRWMAKYGVKRVSWGVFVVVVVIVSLATTLVWISPFPNLTKGAYILLGLFISIIQAAVAHTNYSGRYNIITRFVGKLHGWMGRIFLR